MCVKETILMKSPVYNADLKTLRAEGERAKETSRPQKVVHPFNLPSGQIRHSFAHLSCRRRLCPHACILHSRKIKSHKNVQKYFCAFVRYTIQHTQQTLNHRPERVCLQLIQCAIIYKYYREERMVHNLNDKWSRWAGLTCSEWWLAHTAAWKHSIWFEAQCFGSRFQSSWYISTLLLFKLF